MARRDRFDPPGVAAALGLMLILGVNQVLIKLVNVGLQPVFQAGLRSLLAILPVVLLARWLGRSLALPAASRGPALVCGLLFSTEFLLMFLALDYTAVSRASILFYTQPVWVALAAHMLIPGERLGGTQVAGLCLALGGVVLALADPLAAADAGVRLGDIMSLAGAVCWAGIAIVLRTTAFDQTGPEMQLIVQLAISALVLLTASVFFGPWVRELTVAHVGMIGFQVIGVVTLGFLGWLWLVRIYPASQLAAFNFLVPVFGVIGGVLVLGEPLNWRVVAALALVVAGIALVNRTGVRR
ncbi:MAG: DMT family transporter [Pseudomonadota bacterium]